MSAAHLTHEGGFALVNALKESMQWHYLSPELRARCESLAHHVSRHHVATGTVTEAEAVDFVLSKAAEWANAEGSPLPNA